MFVWVLAGTFCVDAQTSDEKENVDKTRSHEKENVDSESYRKEQRYGYGEREKKKRSRNFGSLILGI